MSVKNHREMLLSKMEENSIAIIYSGKETLSNEDEYLPFAVNSNFFYLCDYERAGMILLLGKLDGKTIERMYIDEADDFTERWTGKMPKPEEVKEKAQISDVAYTNSFNDGISRIMSSYDLNAVYLDGYRYHTDDMPSYNAAKAEEFKKLYPSAMVKDIRPLILPLRESKDQEETERIRNAAAITKKGLDELVKRLKPGMTEYQAQAVFEAACVWEGAEKFAFPTIAAGGANACSMHYDTNRDLLRDGDLALFDLGAKYKNYCSDVTRTYPVNGKFSDRQKAVYELVLKANKEVAKKASPGLKLADLEALTCEILGNGLVELGLLDDPKDVRKYYMHSVSHSIGIDAHDASRRGEILKPGWIISDEPGIYIDEEGIGIRIEDDLLITENGCEVLTSDIPKEIEEIEKMME